MPQIHAKLNVFGDYSNGSKFDDTNAISGGITSITVRSGQIIDNIQVNYAGGVAPGHGGQGGSSAQLDFADGELITEISGLYGTWWNVTVIKQLTIVTTKQSQTFGTDSYPETSIPFRIRSSAEYPIIGFYGSTDSTTHGSYVSGLGAIAGVNRLPDFYQVARNQLIQSLYDPAFAQMSRFNEWKWTPNDDKANDKFHDLKAKVTTQDGYYENPLEAQYFNRVKGDIQATGLYTFLQGLPKGGLLHLHPSSMGDYASLLGSAASFSEDTCQVRFWYVNDQQPGSPNGPISPINFDPKSFQWKNAPNKPDAKPNPKLGPYMDLATALKDPVLSKAALDLLVLSPEAMGYIGDIWRLFDPVFPRVGTLFAHPELMNTYYENAFAYLVKVENLNHVEIRTSWSVDNEAISDTKEYAIITAAKKAGISFKIINAGSRHLKDPCLVSPKVLQKVVDTGNAIRGTKSDHVVGFDMVAEEDTGATTAFLMNDFYAAFNQLDNYLPPFFFHDGETDLAPNFDPNDEGNLADPDVVYFNNNLVDAYLLNTMVVEGFQMTTNRVGHGLALIKSPQLFQKYKEAELTVELCPISNQLLRYVTDIRDHPGQNYLAGGLPVSLNSDDPAIYGYQGNSFDFWEASIAWGLDLKMVKVLCFYSLKYSALEGAELDQAIQTWSGLWDGYISNFLA